MKPAILVRSIRRQASMSLRDLAEAAEVATSTVHRIEKAALHPTVEMLERLAQAAGVRLHLEPRVDYATSLVGFARFVGEVVDAEANPVRLAAEFVTRFHSAESDVRRRMIAGEPPSTGDPRWDAFIGALAEWLAVEAGIATPKWASSSSRFLAHGWWVTPLRSMQAWEYAGSPTSFKARGVYLHRDSLVNA